MSVAVIHMYPDDSGTQSFILLGFYIGYASSQILFARLAGVIGGKATLQIAVVVWSFAGMCTPFLLHRKVLVFITRILIGMAEGANYPSQQTLFSWWVPDSERNTAWGFVCCGEAIGTVIALAGAPYVNHTFGWQSIFWISSGTSFAWLFIFTVATTPRPEVSSMISPEELRDIQARRLPLEKFEDVPWRQIFLTPCFWATIMTHCCYNWGFYVGISWLPDYFDSMFHLDFEKAGICSILPYIGLFLSSNVSGYLADTLIDRQWPVNIVRKGANTIGLGGPMICFFLLGQLGKGDLTIAVALLTIGISCGGFAVSSGYWSNFADLSPRFSPYFLSVSNSIASIPGIVGNWFTGFILRGHKDDWFLVFTIVAALELLGLAIFILFASTEPIFEERADYLSFHGSGGEGGTAAGRRRPRSEGSLMPCRDGRVCQNV